MIRFHDRTRAGALVALALAATLPAAGCQTLSGWPKTTTTTSTSGTNPTPGGPEPGGPKTDFHREVAPDQEYNVHVELARFHESQESYEAAVTEYQKAAEVCERRGSALANHGKLGPAQHSLAERRTASALDRLGRFAQAEPHYLKALKLTPNDPKVWNDAGYSYYLQRRYADAERTLKTADTFEPNNPRVQTNLGLTLAAQGKDADALIALTNGGGPAVGHANLGYILAAMGKTEPAREHYRSALAIQPELAAARQALAKLDPGPSKAPATAVALMPPAPAPAPAVKPAEASPAPAEAVTEAPAPAEVKDPEVSRTSAEAPEATAEH